MKLDINKISENSILVKKNVAAKKEGKDRSFLASFKKQKTNEPDKGKNWTLGCISVKNKDVGEVYNIFQVGRTIEIIP